ncbi:DUF2868 domain-containing protein [Ramlibacter ginsenosidimutans]|uniref:DUF2868 domain-containing protein n=1 Tax=Ramlibacter ginsenosidimutans TaxID=502333 RepID=A0A934U098_9BURK|nr:DUF2868 domain-containing protein [Ramlibacter ginsenosidimutans]
MEDGILHLDEPGARRLVLVRAIEAADPQGRLVGEAEREQAEREALDASREPGGRVDPAEYLQQRARRVLAKVELRNPRIASLQQPEAWRPMLLVALPLLACVLGMLLDHIDHPHQVNMLSPPLLGVLAWNLLVYLLIAATVWRPRKPHRGRGIERMQRWISGLPLRTGRAGRLRAEVLAGFHAQWLKVTGPQQWLWGEQLLHVCAAGWALGLALSIVLGGVVREYRVGWESTLLDVQQVHALLAALFAPVVALLPFDAFSVADLQRMAFRSGAAIGVDEARRWVWMYVALLFVVVIVPRLLLAAWTSWRRRRLGRAVRIDLRDPYFAQLLARVSPACVTLGVFASEGASREALLRLLREVADHPAPREGAWSVLTTGRGDELRVFEVPSGYRAPAPAVAAHAGGAGAAQVWLQDLLGRFKTMPREQGDPVSALLAETDLVLLLPGSPVDLEDAKRLLHWVAQPALVLVAGDDVPYRTAVQRLGLAAEVLPLAHSLGHWLRDPALLQAMAKSMASSKRAGFDRVAAAWKERNAARFAHAMRLLAGELTRAARDSEETGGAPVGLRQLVNPAERDATQRAREAARAALLVRVREGESRVFSELVQLHRAGAPVAALAAGRMAGGFHEQRAVDSPQAGMAGAATGAAMGAGIDLLTGGLTLGAATALGAMIGGGAAYAAAAWKNRGSASGPPQVQLGDELLETVAEGLLLAYLVTAHRTIGTGEAGVPDAWRSEVVAAVAARRPVLGELWQQLRVADDAQFASAALARELEGIARGLLARLEGPPRR